MDIERRIEGAKSPVERDQLLYVALSLWFTKFSSNPSFKLPKPAARIYERALEITLGQEEQLRSQVLGHPLDYAFLVSRRHHLDKHIQTLAALGNEARVRFSGDGELLFHTGESVSAARKTADADPQLVLDLDYFQLRWRREGEPATRLCPNFQFQGDGRYYVSVMTDCPENSTTFLNHHCWLRLTDAKGRVISIGKFPMKIDAPFYLAKKAAYYSNADRYEWLGRATKKEHRIRVSKREYLRLKSEIEADIRAASSCSIERGTDANTSRDFNFFVHNCADWALERVSKIVTIKGDEIRRSQFSVLLPDVYHRVVKRMPKPLRLFFAEVRVFLGLGINGVSLMLALLLGGWRRNQANPTSSSLLKTWCKVFLHTDITGVTLPFFARQWLDRNLERITKEREPALPQ